ncbi:hypothetical protein [Massilia sp. TSP1-1-2]|uniref:hypothetical protein n=1 Tax=Massilia sp. TSP1-1-2 TaxID=2804649 RepID=UPI003CEF5DF7
MPLPPAPALNLLLASLNAAARTRLFPHLVLVELAAGEIVFASGTQQVQVYFPVTATILLSYQPGNGTATEISLVGNEGVIGIPLFLQEKVSPCSAVVCDAGFAYQISAAVLTGELNRPGPALRLILAYARGLSAQMAQTAHCDMHSIAVDRSCATCSHAARCPKTD